MAKWIKILLWPIPYNAQQGWKKTLINILFGFLAIYLALLTFLFFYQRNLLYLPDTNRPGLSEYDATDAVIAHVKTSDGLNLQGWYFRAADPLKHTIVLFHGNAHDHANRLYKMRPFIDQGFGVLLAAYRGFGGNPGSPTEQGLYTDARAYIDWLKSEHDIPSQEIVLYGESLGSGVSVQMATEYDFAGVILEAPYTSTADVAQITYFYVPVKWLMLDQFRSIDKIRNVTEPLLVIHGTFDLVVPYFMGQRLYEAANQPKTFVTMRGAHHNNLYDHDAALHVARFLSTIRNKETK